ncbi:MAG: glycosidase [Verrucomicrobiae bacterium]|nr:glycosidase [Verrucomicrobiae bacterium]
MKKTIKLERYEGNPIMRANPAHNWESQHVSNAGAAIFNGKVQLLYRAEGDDYRKSCPTWPVARIGLAASSDGFHLDSRNDLPVIDRYNEGLPQINAVEDPRITQIGDTYYIVYVVTSLYGDQLALATTKDFIRFEKHGLLMEHVSQRTSGLLPEKINDEYVLFHRIMPNIWVSYSKDLKTWHGSKIVMTRKFNHWTDKKIGIGAPPIKGKNSWILFFHARDRDDVYRLGIAWLDLNDPSKVIKVQDEPILEPEMEYEKKGFVPNVVYTSGAVPLGDKYFVYYGCADQCLAVATVGREEVEL